MTDSPIQYALDLLIEAELRGNDSAYAAAAVRTSHALIVLFESSEKTIEDFSLEKQQVIEDSYLIVYGKPRTA